MRNTTGYNCITTTKGKTQDSPALAQRKSNILKMSAAGFSVEDIQKSCGGSRDFVQSVIDGVPYSNE
jgi:hypothetical protein